MTRPQQLQRLVWRHSEAKWMQNTFERIVTYAYKCVGFNGRNPNFSMTTKRVFFLPFHLTVPQIAAGGHCCTSHHEWQSRLFTRRHRSVAHLFRMSCSFFYVIYHDNDVPNEYVTFLYVQMRWFPWLATVTEMLFPTLQYHTLPLEFAAVQVISSSARRHRSVF